MLQLRTSLKLHCDTGWQIKHVHMTDPRMYTNMASFTVPCFPVPCELLQIIHNRNEEADMCLPALTAPDEELCALQPPLLSMPLHPWTSTHIL